MSATEENWQTLRTTIRERTKFMLNNNLFSDVKFVVRKTVGDSSSKKVILAHKFVLLIGSPVFEAMFYGELAETRDSIELPDCEYESLLELFRYMYSDEVNLSESNVMGVLYLAKKYMLPSLVDKCTEYLQNHLDPSNVFGVLPLALKSETKNLVDRCWQVIDQQTKDAIKPGNGFMAIERSLLEAVVVRDTLNIKEVDLFCAVDLWAKMECERQGLTTDGKTKREVLGEQIIKAIRFPTMEQVDFAAVALDSKILTTKEIVSVIQHINSVSNCPVEFPDIKRSGFMGDIQRCCRFGCVTASRSWNYGSSKDCINFSTDNDVMLRGVGLFGSEINSYWVKLEIKNAENKSVLASKVGWFSSEILHGKRGQYYGFEVILDTVLLLKQYTTYSIEALITGPDSLGGGSGFKSVECSGVTVTFMNNKYSGNGTSIGRGQFPELLFGI